MISIFKNFNDMNVRTFTPSRLDLLRNNAEENMIRTKHHYRRSVYTVPSNHLLVQILQHIPIGVNVPDNELYYRAQTMASRFARALNLNTDSVLSGLYTAGGFYGPGVKTFILLQEQSKFLNIDYSKVWTDIQPLRSISHPYSDLEMHVSNGKQNATVSGDAFLSLDLGLLAIQYKYWLAATEKYVAKPNITQFVFQYPLVNLLETETDVAFFNRIQAKFTGETLYHTTRTNGLALKDLATMADEVIKDFLSRFLTGPRNYYQIAQQTPLIFKDNLREQLILPDLFFNRQTLGIYTLAYLPYLVYLTQVVLGSTSNFTQEPYTHLNHWYLRLVAGKYFEAIPGANPQGTLQVLQDEVLTPLLRNPKTPLPA